MKLNTRDQPRGNGVRRGEQGDESIALWCPSSSHLFINMSIPPLASAFTASLVSGIVGAALIFGGAMGYLVRKLRFKNSKKRIPLFSLSMLTNGFPFP